MRGLAATAAGTEAIFAAVSPIVVGAPEVVSGLGWASVLMPSPDLPIKCPFFHFSVVSSAGYDGNELEGHVVKRRAASIVLIVSALCGILLLLYGSERLGPLADQAVLVAMALLIGDLVVVRLRRRRDKKNPNPADSSSGRVVLSFNRAMLAALLVIVVFGLFLLALGFIFPAPASIVWTISGGGALIYVVATIIRIRRQS